MLYCLALKTRRTHVDWKPQSAWPSLQQPVSSCCPLVHPHVLSPVGDRRAAVWTPWPFVSRKVLRGWSVFRVVKSPTVGSVTQTERCTQTRRHRGLETMWLTETPRLRHKSLSSLREKQGHGSCKHLRSRCFSPACCTITFLYGLNDFSFFLFLIPTLWSHNGSVSCSETPPVSLISPDSPSVLCRHLGLGSLS